MAHLVLGVLAGSVLGYLAARSSRLATKGEADLRHILERARTHLGDASVYEHPAQDDIDLALEQLDLASAPHSGR